MNTTEFTVYEAEDQGHGEVLLGFLIGGAYLLNSFDNSGTTGNIPKAGFAAYLP